MYVMYAMYVVDVCSVGYACALSICVGMLSMYVCMHVMCIRILGYAKLCYVTLCMYVCVVRMYICIRVYMCCMYVCMYVCILILYLCVWFICMRAFV